MQSVLNKDKKLTNEKARNSGLWCFAVEVVEEGSPGFVVFTYQ